MIVGGKILEYDTDYYEKAIMGLPYHLNRSLIMYKLHIPRFFLDCRWENLGI
jgi:hypothetical protein